MSPECALPGLRWSTAGVRLPGMRIVSWVLCGFVAVASAIARPFTVAAYNVENLHDADGVAEFDDYKAERYTKTHVLTKVQNAARLMAQFENGRGPDVIMFNEIEVDFTPATTPLDFDAILKQYAGVKIEDMLGAKFTPEIGDLPAEALLVKAFADRGLTGYHVVVPASFAAADSTRTLGQKCVLFTRFPVKAARTHVTADARPILEALLEVDGAPLYVFVNHWKSGASDAVTEKTRIANAQTLRTRIDEILRADPSADIILGGDLNSQYNQSQRYASAMPQTAINTTLGSQGNELAVRDQRDLYNLWYELPPAQRGSDTYRGEWGTLMHLIVSRGLYDYRGVQYVDNSFAVGKFIGVNADAAGLPVRWNGEGPTGSGFSDHFPLIAHFTTVTDNRTDRFVELKNPGVERPEAEVIEKIDYAGFDLEKVAVRPDQIGAEGIRNQAFNGKVFRVEGKVTDAARQSVEFRGEVYEIYSYDAAVRDKLKATYPPGSTIKFYGELSQYQTRWQFVVQDASWVK